MQEDELKEVDIDEQETTRPKMERRLSYYPNEEKPLGIMQMMTEDHPKEEEVEVIEGKGKFLEFDQKTRFYYEIDGDESNQKLILLNPYISTLRIYDELVKNLVIEGFCVLRFDYRCLGKTESIYEKVTSTISAMDAAYIIEKLNWNGIHVFGYGIGGMVAQELALILSSKNNLSSLYLASTSSGSFFRFSGGPDFYEDAVLNFVLNKSESEQQIQFIHDNVSDSNKSQVTPIIQDNWKIFFDHRMKARTTQCAIYYGHYVSLKRLSTLRGKIPITVQLSKEDNFHKIEHQNWLVNELKANKVELGGCTDHLDALFIKVKEMAQYISNNTKSLVKN
eukprot:TRINITY_DN7506_c0_g1_i1.p1 TRINITY_DN7506_c0_g1~~TRINITY_DN7506_c0_g1_i1.p1  ORF type:complete len:336 (-),score=77.53 TRINITY_DN7506_c0_g1_i1:65-1072(-)